MGMPDGEDALLFRFLGVAGIVEGLLVLGAGWVPATAVTSAFGWGTQKFGPSGLKVQLCFEC